MSFSRPVVLFCIAVPCCTVSAADPPTVELHSFQKQKLTSRFFSEGACFADIDGDGKMDVVSGPFWYAGPAFDARHRYMPGEAFSIKAYSKHFFSFAHDFNSDGRPDILVIPIPGEPAHWFENPGTPSNAWKRHLVIDRVDGESPHFEDLTGNGRPELICIYDGAFGYAAFDPEIPESPWTFTPVTDRRGYGRFTHGLGVGDINGDGRQDLLETNGWWEQLETPEERFQFHGYPFAQSGGAQMFAYDFDGDGDNDVVSSQNAHSFGLTWFEQRRSGSSVGFIPHPILTEKAEDNPYGITISQMHAIALADIDGDGVKDIVTGKRFWAHGGSDPGAQQLPVLYWFRTIRSPAGVEFEPWPVDQRSGVGTQLTVGDIDGDKQPDIVVGSKLGTFVFRHRVKQVITTEFESRRPKKGLPLERRPGTSVFSSTERPTEPLSPQEELKTFVLPAGFEAQLVASEPDIAKPLNMAFDARGRLWVTDSVEYPMAAPNDRPGRDTIKVLEDTDGDGRADVITTFADGLNIPMGLYPYKDGVVCFSIPNILFLRDTDGDGKADKREKLLGPFDCSRDTHGMCNGFTRGFDGWLYACHGFNNQSEVAGQDGHKVTLHSGNTFRMRLDGSRIEHLTQGHVNPFGMTFDPNGDLFNADCHTKPINLLMPGGYYDGFGKPHDGLGYVPNVMEHMHGSTAIGGIAQYIGSNFPDEYHGSTFGGNVMTSRINRNSLIHHGSSVRAQEEPDFLIAGDPWFRPTELQVGPDGALYVTDFYNRIIGHYEIDLDHPGRDRHRGRIWRIVYTGSTESKESSADAVALTKLDVDELAKHLDSPNHTVRTLVSDRLTDHFGSASVSPARRILFDPQQTSSARAHALWVLHRLDASKPTDIATAIDSNSPALLRNHGFRVIAETPDARLPTEAKKWIAACFRDPDALVRRSAVMASAKHTDESNLPELLKLSDRTPEDDVHLRHALRMAVRNHLQTPGMLNSLARLPLSTSTRRLLTDVCMALNTPEAGAFLIRHISDTATVDPERLSATLRNAVTKVSGDEIAAIAELAQKRFRNDSSLQLELIESVRQGLAARGESNTAVHTWAIDLSKSLLSIPHPDSNRWTFRAIDSRPRQANPWTVQKRTSSDGDQSWFLSSLPQGERRTGILRSSEFRIPESLSFYSAGHNGPTGEPETRKNFIRLYDAQTNDLLAEATPPRNDTAQKTEWSLAEHAGKRGCIELVDGFNAPGFAWLAVGRFSVSELNPAENEVIAGDETPEPLSWAFAPHPGKPDRGNPWVISTRRDSADGERSSKLFSSFPKGEQWTGIYRSQAFEVGETFSFFTAGHIGRPGDPVHAENFIRLRDAETQELLREATPPRNDTARKIEWKTGDIAGRSVYVELIDGDTDSGFAWLAVGRFSVSGLNPSRTLADRRRAAQLITSFKLTELRDTACRFLKRSIEDRETSREFGRALAALANDSRLDAIAEALGFSGVDEKTRAAAVDVLIENKGNAAIPVLESAMKSAPMREQSRIAEILSSGSVGAAALISLVETGKASASLLKAPEIAEKLGALPGGKLSEKINELTAQLPDEDAKIAELISARRESCLGIAGSRDAGAELFRKNCSNCHQVAGQGNKIGPNLDGIGNRGLERLLEDTLAPNRNVDVAFRTTTIITDEGRVLSGLFRRTEGTQLILADGKGREFSVPVKSIDERIPSRLSLMPANLGEKLSEEDFRNLMSYLLSLRQNQR